MQRIVFRLRCQAASDLTEERSLLTNPGVRRFLPMPYWFAHRSNAADLSQPANWKYADEVRWLGFVFFYVVLANVPFWTASRWLGLMPLGWFCIEYAAVGLLSLFVPGLLTGFLLLLVIAADLIGSVSKTYFLAPSQCFANVAGLQEFPESRRMALAAVIALTLFVVAIGFRFPARKLAGAYRISAIACLSSFIAIAVCMDGAWMIRNTGHLLSLSNSAVRPDAKSLSYFGHTWASRYPEIRLVRGQRMLGGSWGKGTAALSQAPIMASAADVALRFAGLDVSQPPRSLPNVVVVLTESWGVSKDPVLRDALVRAYAQPSLLAQYDVSQGAVPFYGPTIGGEGRELCGSRIGAQIVDVPGRGLRTCLPERLSALGYRSVALHGMDGNMYHRSTWYRSIGFNEQWFRSDFRKQGLPDCPGAFMGTCDAAVAGWIGERLRQRSAASEEGPSFIYWVTLNSHLPEPVPSALPNPATCSLTAMLAARPALCSWYQLVANVHDSVARIAMSNLDRPTVFVIVGDHAPPFSSTELRSQFSGSEVPYVILSPRRDVPLRVQTATLQQAASHDVMPGAGSVVVVRSTSLLAENTRRIQYIHAH
jgi:hypothetical protein